MQRLRNHTIKPATDWRGSGQWLLLLALLLLLSPAVLADSGLTATILAEAKKLGLKSEEVSFSLRLPDGDVIEHRGTEARAPASCMKLVVAAATLDLLGPEHHLKTELMRLGQIEDGVLRGDLLVIGGGDPAICGRENSTDPLWELRPWMAKLETAGIDKIEGRVLADVRYFSGGGVHPDWPRAQLQRWYCAPSGALNLNDNCIDVLIGPVTDGEVSVQLKPMHPLLSLRNKLVVTSNKKDHLYHISRDAAGWGVTVSGKFLRTSGQRTEWVTVPDPADGFVSILLQMIRDSGISVEGKILPPASRALPVASTSHTLASRLPVMLKNSQNLYADALARVLGRERGGDGSFQSAAARLAAWIDGRFPGHEGVVVRDGSGLSRQNRLDARLLRQIIEMALKSRWGSILLDALPVAAVDGTLDGRFQSTPLAGKLRAKTGTIRGVISLAGMFETSAGPVTFCLIYEGRHGFASRARDWQDRSLLRVETALRGRSEGQG
ncbi:MAG: D-alanyl-D-alanine carboxypeptidase/D-alanyl-D-alanine-endopeptidase [Bacillota bacterium]|nr:MAG: D-alanyl-D-alanine carboxypeptidase/D-alanyl-D-alanine-endopeptidase [Bacillota bacterium]